MIVVILAVLALLIGIADGVWTQRGTSSESVVSAVKVGLMTAGLFDFFLWGGVAIYVPAQYFIDAERWIIFLVPAAIIVAASGLTFWIQDQRSRPAILRFYSSGSRSLRLRRF